MTRGGRFQSKSSSAVDSEAEGMSENTPVVQGLREGNSKEEKAGLRRTGT